MESTRETPGTSSGSEVPVERREASSGSEIPAERRLPGKYPRNAQLARKMKQLTRKIKQVAREKARTNKKTLDSHCAKCYNCINPSGTVVKEALYDCN